MCYLDYEYAFKLLIYAIFTSCKLCELQFIQLLDIYIKLNIDNLAFFCHIVLFSFHTDWDIPDRSIRFLIFFSSRSDVPEGLFLATTSSIVAFVEDFNQFFKCASNSGKCKGMFSDY